MGPPKTMTSTKSGISRLCPASAEEGFVLIPRSELRTAAQAPVKKSEADKETSDVKLAESKEIKQSKDPDADAMIRVLKLHKSVSVPTRKGQEIKTTLTTCNYFNITSAGNDYALDFNVSGCGEWAAFAGLYDEFEVTMIHVELNWQRWVVFGDTPTTNSNVIYLWAYDPTVSAAKTFDKVADYSNSAFCNFSVARPVIKRKCKPMGLRVSASDTLLRGFQPCSMAANALQGSLLVSGTSPVTTSPSALYYKIVFDVRFRLRQGS